MPAYITGLGVCLPNDAVDNEHIEGVLGMIHGEPARSKEMILEANGIKARYYAINPRTGEQTHTNAQMAAQAICTLSTNAGFDVDEMGLLACGTACGDQVIPNHAVMVHGLLRRRPCEVVSTAGACCSGMTALKYGAMSVSSGATTNAVVTASELVSAALSASHFESQTSSGESEPRYLSFDEEFLRWMLSDGAAAVLLEPQPGRGPIALRIDWLDILSFANEIETCMYMGGAKRPDGTLQGWLRTGKHSGDPWAEGYFNLAQDIRVLQKRVVAVMTKSFSTVLDKRKLTADTIDWLLPHLSSEYFRQPVCTALAGLGFAVPPEKWFTNLSRKGNTGSASIFIMLEELFSSGRLKKGDRILCAVPESARFTFAYMHLTVV
jgi:3-oxoacyl-[acyl-carrier-protein] synthase-3